MNIIIVDDEAMIEPIFQLHFRQEIANQKVHLHFFQSPKKALIFCCENTISLLITDVNMPEMSGYALVENLKKKGFSAPIFMITAYQDEETERKAKELGVTAFFTKPVDLKELKIRILALA